VSGNVVFSGVRSCSVILTGCGKNSHIGKYIPNIAGVKDGKAHSDWNSETCEGHHKNQSIRPFWYLGDDAFIQVGTGFVSNGWFIRSSYLSDGALEGAEKVIAGCGIGLLG
jgi:hypothetical protein